MSGTVMSKLSELSPLACEVCSLDGMLSIGTCVSEEGGATTPPAVSEVGGAVPVNKS